MTPVRLVLVDDHLLVRSGIRKLLESLRDMVIVGEAGTANEALVVLSQIAADILLLDVSLPVESGLQALPRIRRQFPDLKIIILSMYASEAFARQARDLGASGYVVKDRSPEDLEAVIRQVAADSPFVGGVAPDAGTCRQRAPLDDLTARQVEILRLIAAGKTHREIADRLFVTEKTIEHHRSNIKQTLGIYDTAGLVLFAVRHGLISPAELDFRPGAAS